MKAEIVDKFPHPIREVEYAQIPLSDGINLAVRYWLPVDAESNPVPAILEYIPYCTRDGTAARDEAMHPYFAGHGYAAIRVDIRGSGESEGVLLDEYLKLEQDDAVEVIAWIAAQSWCNGKVGMMGKSWGGFNGLQVAARQPEALKCIITVFFTDDRYADDVHYLGGCMLLENPAWAFAMFPSMARPPDPLLVGENWRELWMQRLEANRPWLIDWASHQRRDEYWKHGSVCEDFSQIKVPVYAIGGWADPYSNPIPRVLAGLDVPRKGLIGPWGHNYMHQAVPGPQMGYMDEAMRWWDYWLKDIDTGIMEEPSYRVWVQDSVKPSACYQQRPGYWAAESGWPSDNIKQQVLHFTAGGLSQSPSTSFEQRINSPQTTGRCSPFYGNMGRGDPQDPIDQRADDAHSICVDGEVLDQELTIWGAPIVTLELAVDKPEALVCVRLNELRSDGQSLQVSYGLLNLTHRSSHEILQPMKPGKRQQITVALNDIAHTFAAGSKIRLAVSTAFWPVVWPSPEAATLSLFGGSKLTLPLREPRPTDKQLPELAAAKQSRVHPRTILAEPEPTRAEFNTELASGLQTFTYAADSGRIRFDNHGWIYSDKSENCYQINPDDPLSARMDCQGTQTYGREGQLDIRIEATQSMSCDKEFFYITASLEAFEDGQSVFAKNWQQSIKRDGV